MSDAELSEHEEALRLCHPAAWRDNTQSKYYKVEWTRVPDLVEKRKVYLRAGVAFVPAQELSSVIFQQFQTDLEAALEVSDDYLSLPKRLQIYSKLLGLFLGWTRTALPPSLIILRRVS